MKILIVVLCLVAVVNSQSTTCQHQSDCPSEQCCVHSGLFGMDQLELLGRKRFLFNHVGHCQPYRKLNETCNPILTHDIFNHELYESHCPCEKPLDCRGETVHESPGSIQHINPKCQTQENN